ncbi:hypothetical protein HMPREF1556_01560 [Porphyromonas sp. oral taxon 278 str. W7784]|nr:hypothetical protein HMPREF1556_01560 [Porphyromonas sp. oral taxon 278 str. W7784]
MYVLVHLRQRYKKGGRNLGLPKGKAPSAPSLRKHQIRPVRMGSPKGGKKPTVGRRKNLLWVVSPTCRSHRRPTVGFILGLSGEGRATLRTERFSPRERGCSELV